MTANIDCFGRLKKARQILEAVKSPSEIAYFAQEVLRFCSIAGSLRESNILNSEIAVERNISHILTRSLLEGFFWLIYIFDDPAKRNDRYQERTNSFKREYGKLWNKLDCTRRRGLEPANRDWHLLANSKDTNTILTQIKNNRGERYDYLYVIYRIASFDTHGNSVEALFRSAFGKADCEFLTLDMNHSFDLISNEYLDILEKLYRSGEINQIPSESAEVKRQEH